LAVFATNSMLKTVAPAEFYGFKEGAIVFFEQLVL
jgi:hypothetical protein